MKCIAQQMSSALGKTSHALKTSPSTYIVAVSAFQKAEF